jgi:hypothetical protein
MEKTFPWFVFMKQLHADKECCSEQIKNSFLLVKTRGERVVGGYRPGTDRTVRNQDGIQLKNATERLQHWNKNK